MLPRNGMAAAADLPRDLAAAFQFSRYAERLRSAEPGLVGDVLAAIEHPWRWHERAQHGLADAPHAEALASGLRDLRRRVFLTVLLRDLSRRADLAEVCSTVTRLAEIAVAAAASAHARWLADIHGDPVASDSGAVQRLIVVAMGKLGGSELNVSSDIDLVFVYPEDGVTNGPRPVSNQEFFDRLGRRIIAALGATTPQGYVFRVDMRLRPHGESGALSSSFAALEHYLLTQGRTWERYAWLKARPLTGDRGDDLVRLITPFVFRKYLDYDAYAGLRDVHRQIREQGRRLDYAANLKLGPGGIREIEFIVQALQLVRGGRESALRQRETLAALGLLGDRGLLPAAAVAEIEKAYVFLRNTEHRLQYRDDAQTQDVPADALEREALALASGFDDAAAFDAALERQRATVERHFDALFSEADIEAEDSLSAVWLDPAPGDGRTAALATVGYSDPEAVIASLARLRASARYLQLPPLSRQRFDALVPQLLRAAATSNEPRSVLERLLALLEAISGRSAYLALLFEHPPVLPRLAELMGASAWAAEHLTRHPILLDELLDSRTLFAEPDWNAWRSELATPLSAHDGDVERQMDDLRHFQHAQSFRLLAQDLTGRLTVERLADHLSALADVVLEATLSCCWTQMQGPKAPPPKFAIIGYGKLGGKELGYASDLDLVFLYDDEDEVASQRYARLATRMNTWLTCITPAGRLYDTDLRLRPDGVSGLMVSSLAGFRAYQLEHAWTWEHQALTRARFVAGERSIGAAFEALREAILRLARDPAKLRADVVSMRRRMHLGHPNRTAQFDLKHDPGGMVDVEFSVQYLVLAFGHAHPALARNAGNIALLSMCAELGLLERSVASAAADAYRAYRRLQHQLRLQGAHEARVDPQAQVERRRAVAQLWTAVFGQAWSEADAGNTLK